MNRKETAMDEATIKETTATTEAPSVQPSAKDEARAEMKALTTEAQRLARMAGHVRLRGEGWPNMPGALGQLRQAVAEARTFEEATAKQREAAAASLAKLRDVAIDPETARLLTVSESEATRDSEANLFAIVARCRAWPKGERLAPSEVARRLSVKVRRSGEYVCAHGVSRQAVYRAFGAASKHAIPTR
jgi:hypothetical protein